jgi:catechol 2,3-dioxygenase-like lactoylglutathione lyase family enzyme
MGMKIEKDSVDLGIVCEDGPAMLAFYRDVLGLEHVADTQLPKPFAGTMHRLMCGTSLIKLVVPEKSPGNPPAPGGLGGGTGYRYWTVTVGNLDEVVADAEGGGHKVAVPRTNVRPGVDIAMLVDPDGNWVELLETSE